MEQDYAAWVASTDTCNACGSQCASEANEYLINERIRPAPFRSLLPLPVVPQAGYLGPMYETQKHRYLVLGLNPAGEWEGHDFYKWQGILASSTGGGESDADEILFRAASDHLMAHVSGPEWTHLQNLELFRVLDPREIAYANQVLCRTTRSASDLPANASKKFRTICWEERVRDLIHILAPDIIVGIGKGWGIDLTQLVANYDWGKQIEVKIIPFPAYSWQGKARDSLKEYVEEVNLRRQPNELNNAR